MWTFKQSHVAALRAAAEKFTAETGTKVNIQAVTPDDAFLTKVQAAARTNDLPDVLEVHANGDDLAFGGAGLLEDLSKDVDQKWLAQYLPQVLTDGTVTPDVYKASLTEGSKTQGVQLGQRFSVPLTVGTQGVVYMNKSRAAKAGVTRAPATWEEFIDALDKVTKAYPDNGGVTVGVKQPSTALEWLMQPMAFGMLGKQKFEALFGPDTAQGWSSPNGQKVLNTYNEVTPYWMPGTQSKGIDEADLAFAQGKASFDIGGTYTLAFLAENGYDADNLMTFPVPPPKDAAIPGLQLSPFSLTGLSITRTSDKKDEALRWLKFLSRDDVAADFGKQALDVPPNDLDKKQSEALGPVLNSMEAAFGSGKNSYNAGYTAYRPSLYDPGKVGAVLAQFTPLKSRSAESTGAQMSSMLKSYWAEQNK
ncbi:extracellular solute-binding protein [Streptomyces scopuliridis]|uniref:ABC transporter substrate-binding protein n=1 Tax=Streptomyces scopuliridis TaxID=452529 RepID=UPI002DDC805A|nr:extracellular solute-binding protein [Streptomyces scopuliridis]WSB32935.1 extracellular solute-binding protein [Streptomyces scopuliridis]